MHSLCRFYSLSEFPTDGKVPGMTQRATRKFWEFGSKNGLCAKSVNSFDFGVIFHPRLGEYLSRNAFFWSIPFPGRIFYVRKGPGYVPKNKDFREKLRAIRNNQRMLAEAFRAA